MKNSKRKIIIGGIALLAYVAHVLTAALDSKPGDVSKAQFVVQLGADKKLTDAAADRTLTLDFGEPFKHAPTSRTLPQLVTVTDVYTLKNTGSEELSRRVFFPVNYLRSDDERVSITLDGKAAGRWYGVGEQPFVDGSTFASDVESGKYCKAALENDTNSGEGFAYYVIELTLKAGQSAELRLEYPLENASSILVLNDESTVACDSSRLIINDPNRIKLSCSDEAVAVSEYGGELDLSEGPEQFTINIG
ncbi:MAG: hypothetical protein KHW95_04480 [Firmicutes bacterium]|nr:hypothetical protein [Bacillota bacterium]